MRAFALILVLTGCADRREPHSLGPWLMYGPDMDEAFLTDLHSPLFSK